MNSPQASLPAYRPDRYWEERARRFAVQDDGLAAVCSYGLPRFYNRVIHLSQRLALAPWLYVESGARVLDVGCGVGRWSCRLAAAGAQVTGIDLSPTMVLQARWHAQQQKVWNRCRFLVEDVTTFDTGERFDLVLGVTVLQHILDPAALRAAVQRMAAHLAPGGRMVLLEAAPTCLAEQCNTAVFEARERDSYLRLFSECGLELKAITGVDPSPFKTWVLPHWHHWSRTRAVAALACATALSLPVDVLFGRHAVRRSWHAVFVLQSRSDPHAH